jgi:hypothetical protein
VIIQAPSYRPKRQRALTESGGGWASSGGRLASASQEPSTPKSLSSLIKDRRAKRARNDPRKGGANRMKSKHWSTEAIERRYADKG